jgi:oligopeptidase A
VDEPGVSAFAAVEWDAIELPSQFMENFCWEWQVLQRLTAHIDSNEPLPKDLYDRMKAARNFQSGMQTVRQIEFSLFDIQLHNRRQGLSIAEVLTQLDQVREEVAVIRPPSWHRFPHSFSHLFAGGYGAGYYSYKWAEVLSADAFEAFEEAAARSAVSAHQASESLGTLDPETGMKFRREVLAENCISRNKGSITIDNIAYGRYSGELQICKRDLAFDERVNLIGRVSDDSLHLLDYIGDNQRFKLVI